MNAVEDPPAFPTSLYSRGMTLRDYFAAQVACGLLCPEDYDAESVARAAYILADAMLAARKP